MVRADLARRGRQHDLVDLGHRRGIRDVEQRDLEALVHARAGVDLTADPEQQAVSHGVQVLGEPGDLQLAEQRGRAGVGQVDRVERVGLAEGHHVGDVVEEAHGLHLLADAHAVEVADLVEGARRCRAR